MTYAYVIVYTLLTFLFKYITFKYIIIVYLAMGCQKTCRGSFLYIKILSYFIYYKMYVSFWWTCAFTMQ